MMLSVRLAPSLALLLILKKSFPSCMCKEKSRHFLQEGEVDESVSVRSCPIISASLKCLRSSTRVLASYSNSWCTT